MFYVSYPYNAGYLATSFKSCRSVLRLIRSYLSWPYFWTVPCNRGFRGKNRFHKDLSALQASGLLYQICSRGPWTNYTQGLLFPLIIRQTPSACVLESGHMTNVCLCHLPWLMNAMTFDPDMFKTRCGWCTLYSSRAHPLNTCTPSGLLFFWLSQDP